MFIMSYQGKSIHFMHFNRCVFDFTLPEKNIFPSFSADDVKQSVCILQFKAKLKNNSNNALQTASCRHRNVLCSGTGPTDLELLRLLVYPTSVGSHPERECL